MQEPSVCGDLFVTLRPPFLFQQAQYVQVFPLKPVPFCKLFAGLGSTNKSAISLLFSLTLALSSPPSTLIHLSFYLNLSRRSGRNRLLFTTVLSSYNGTLETHFFQGTTWLISWPDRERYLRSLQSHAVFPLIFCIFSSLFLDWRHTVSLKLNTQISPISTEELLLPWHARCVLSCLCCNRHSLLLSFYLTRSGRIKNPLCSTYRHLPQDTSHLIVLCPAIDSLHCSVFGNSLSLYELWSRPWGVAQLLELHDLLPCLHSLEGVM